MNNFHSFQTYLNGMENALSENDRKDIKKEFDIFFHNLDSNGKKEFNQFQMSIAEKIRIEINTIKNTVNFKTTN
jgi:hypothetical protein